MLPKIFKYLVLGVLLFASACSNTAVSVPNTATLIQVESSPIPEQPTTGADAASVALPDAPAPIDGDFRPDSYLLVGATGRPQIVETFSYE